MEAVTKALYDVLNGDATLVALGLGSYPPGESGKAIFSSDPVPGDAEAPYIVIRGALSNDPLDTKTTRGREISVEITVIDEATGSELRVMRLAERVRALLHRESLSVDGFDTLLALVSGPTKASTDANFYGRDLIVALQLSEQ